jgi:4-amino-4-deoxy-L-arabinose transferase-like glycosyltransferase
VSRIRGDRVLLVILFVALALRVHLASTRAYIHDENNTAIPLSKTISFTPGRWNLPLRGENHGALPAYVVKFSGDLFGTSRLGYRGLHILLGLCTVALVFLLTRDVYGPVAARWAAALLAFNEYFLGVSSRATAHVPHLFLIAVALFAFARFLHKQQSGYLYGFVLSLGLAFYVKEHSALLLPLCFLTFLFTRNRRWLRSPHPYLAGLVFILVIGIDLVWNLRTNPDTARTSYGGQTVGQATYRSHLRRIGGLGYSPYPSMFYARSTVQSLALSLSGQPLKDETPEYQSMNPAVGALLLGGILMTTVLVARQNPTTRWLLLLFWGVFGFFTLIRPGDPPGRLDPVSWIWVESTIMPAVILAGARLADVAGKWRLPIWLYSAGALAYASTWMATWKEP